MYTSRKDGCTRTKAGDCRLAIYHFWWFNVSVCLIKIDLTVHNFQRHIPACRWGSDRTMTFSEKWRSMYNKLPDTNKLVSFIINYNQLNFIQRKWHFCPSLKATLILLHGLINPSVCSLHQIILGLFHRFVSSYIYQEVVTNQL